MDDQAVEQRARAKFEQDVATAQDTRTDPPIPDVYEVRITNLTTNRPLMVRRGVLRSFSFEQPATFRGVTAAGWDVNEAGPVTTFRGEVVDVVQDPREVREAAKAARAAAGYDVSLDPARRSADGDPEGYGDPAIEQFGDQIRAVALGDATCTFGQPEATCGQPVGHVVHEHVSACIPGHEPHPACHPFEVTLTSEVEATAEVAIDIPEGTEIDVSPVERCMFVDPETVGSLHCGRPAESSYHEHNALCDKGHEPNALCHPFRAPAVSDDRGDLPF